MQNALVVEDSPTVRAWLHMRIGTRFHLHEAENLASARLLLDSQSFDCLFLDYQLPDGQSTQLIQQIRQSQQHSTVPIIVITGTTTPTVIKEVFDAGADEFLRKPLTDEELSARIDHIFRRKQQLAESEHDPLTGVYNRRALMRQAERIIAEASRTGQTFSILLFDLDKYKEYNDSHGHPAGDALLVQLTTLLLKHLRTYDLLFRYGGDEFIILLPGAHGPQGERVAEKIQKLLFTNFGVTISVGVSSYEPDDGWERLLARADHALYAAKSAGRNCTHLCQKEIIS